MAHNSEGADDAASELACAVEDADSRGQGFIARLGRAGAAVDGSPSGLADAAAVKVTCDHIGDFWGAALATLFCAWGRVSTGISAATDAVALRDLTETFRSMGASVLEAWCRALLALALARQGDPQAYATALKAESLANSAAVEGAKVFAFAAMAETGRGNTEQFIGLLTAALARTGLRLALAPEALEASSPAVSIRCFGEFRMTINGRPVAMAGMKPRTRALLRRLCADAGAPIHRDVLHDALWPHTDAESASRNLHVAISSLRHALEPGVARGASSLIVRDGETYRLALPANADVDMRVFDQALERSRRARLEGDDQAAVEAFEQVARISRKELLPEDGSTEWVVERRGRLRAAIVDASRALAARLLARGHPDTAAQVSVAGLDADRYDDALWRLLIEARGRAGDKAGARRAQSDYQSMVEELEAPTRS